MTSSSIRYRQYRKTALSASLFCLGACCYPATASAEAPNSLLLRANHLAAQKNYPAAESTYQKFLAEYPDDVAGHHMYGRVLALLGHYEDALKQYRQALKLKPDDAGIYTDIGVTLTVCGQTNLGARFLHQSCVVNPRFALGLNNLGAALFKLEDFAQAAEFLTKSLSIQPRNVRIAEMKTEALAQADQSKKFDFGEPVTWRDVPEKIVIAGSTDELAEKTRSEQAPGKETVKIATKPVKKPQPTFLDDKPLFVLLSVEGFDSASVSGLGFVQVGDNNQEADKMKEVSFNDNPEIELMGDVTIEFAGVGTVKFGKGTVTSDDPKATFSINAETGEVNCLSGNIAVERWNQVTVARVFSRAQITTSFCKKVYGQDDSRVNSTDCGEVNLVGNATGVIERCDEVTLTDNARAAVNDCGKVSVLSNAYAKVSKCEKVVCLQNGKAEQAKDGEATSEQ